MSHLKTIGAATSWHSGRKSLMTRGQNSGVEQRYRERFAQPQGCRSLEIFYSVLRKHDRLFHYRDGTGVGKTLLTCAMAFRLRQQGKAVRAAQAGDQRIRFRMEWRRAIRTVALGAGLVALAGKYRRGIAMAFAAPLSPAMAAEEEGRPIDLMRWLIFGRDRKDVGILLVEVRAGFMSPLDEEYDAGLGCGAGLSCILVAGSYLGSLSHTLASARAVIASGLAIHAVVVRTLWRTRSRNGTGFPDCGTKGSFDRLHHCMYCKSDCNNGRRMQAYGSSFEVTSRTRINRKAQRHNPIQHRMFVHRAATMTRPHLNQQYADSSGPGKNQPAHKIDRPSFFFRRPLAEKSAHGHTAPIFPARRQALRPEANCPYRSPPFHADRIR